jgi:hypothetical protein
MKVAHGFFAVHPRRSGSHAILRWLMGHGTKSFLANTNVGAHHAVWSYRPSAWLLPNPIGAKEDGLIYNEPKPWDPRVSAELFEQVYDKDISIYCVENAPIEDVEHTWNRFIYGRAEKTHTIVILRSFWNTMASKLEALKYAQTRAQPGRVGAAYRPTDVKGWTRYARAVKALLDKMDSRPIVPILFDPWFEDPQYRRSIERKLLLEESDEGLQVVTNYGRGSSFDLRDFQGKAQQMDVLNRWKTVGEWPTECLTAEEAHELDRLLFGDYKS